MSLRNPVPVCWSPVPNVLAARLPSPFRPGPLRAPCPHQRRHPAESDHPAPAPPTRASVPTPGLLCAELHRCTTASCTTASLCPYPDTRFSPCILRFRPPVELFWALARILRILDHQSRRHPARGCSYPLPVSSLLLRRPTVRSSCAARSRLASALTPSPYLPTQPTYLIEYELPTDCRTRATDHGPRTDHERVRGSKSWASAHPAALCWTRAHTSARLHDCTIARIIVFTRPCMPPAIILLGCPRWLLTRPPLAPVADFFPASQRESLHLSQRARRIPMA